MMDKNKEKLFEEETETYDDGEKAGRKKRFCWWLFVISLVGGALACFLIKIPALIVLVVSIVLNIIFRKEYLIWPQVIVITPNLLFLIIYMLTFVFGNVTNSPM